MKRLILFLGLLIFNFCAFSQINIAQRLFNNQKIVFYEATPDENMFIGYSQSHNKVFLSVVKCNDKIVDIQVVPKRVFDKDYHYIDLIHYIDKSTFSSEQQLALLSKYECGYSKISNSIVIHFISQNNIISYSDSDTLSYKDAYKSYFSFSQGIVPNFIKHSIVVMEFVPKNDEIKSSENKEFGNKIISSEVDFSSCASGVCKINREPLSIFLSLVMNSKGDLVDISTLKFYRQYDQFQFDVSNKIELPIYFPHYLQTKFFSTEETVLMVTDYKSEISEDVLITGVDTQWDYRQNKLKKEIPGSGKFPDFLKHGVIKIKF